MDGEGNGDAGSETKPLLLESAAEFRAFLAEVGESHTGFARTMKRLGDDREKATIERHIQRMLAGQARVTGEMRVIMSIIRNARRKRRKAEAAKGGKNGADHARAP
jgi:hypothetical protein